LERLLVLVELFGATIGEVGSDLIYWSEGTTIGEVGSDLIHWSEGTTIGEVGSGGTAVGRLVRSSF